MTCILGLEHNGKVYIAADSIAVNGWAKDITASRKVFKKGDMLFGCAGNPRQAQLIKYFLSIPTHESGIDDEEYIVRIVDDLRTLFKEKGLTEFENGQEKGAGFLLGYNGKLYSIENAFQVCRSAHGMCAVGAGDDFALASLATMFSAYEKDERSEADAEICLTRALEISAMLSACVSAPFIVECI